MKMFCKVYYTVLSIKISCNQRVDVNVETQNNQANKIA